MKKYYLAALFLVFSFAVSARPSRLVVKPSVPASELYYWSLSGETLPYYTLATKISPEVDGTFRFNVDIRKPAVYYIRIGGEFAKMYITPNGVDSLTVRNGRYEFGGSNKACNTILAELEKSDEYCESYRRVGAHELDKITNLEDFKKLIEARKTKDLDLLLTDVLPNDFVSQQKKDIDIRYRLLLARKICYGNIPNLTDDWLGELKKELNAISQGESATMSYDHSALLKVAVSGRAFVLDKKDPQSVRDTFNSFLFNNYCDILKGASLEYALATLIYEDFFQKNYSKDIPELFYRFKKLFPDSRFIPTLELGVTKTVEFHNVTLNNRDILFVEDTEVNSFEDITRLFAGKVVYINLWTTWPSCINMFSNLEEFEQAVKPMDITYLYIYMAEDENDEKWRKMVYYHQLNGYNLWANPQLSHSLHRQFGDKKGYLSFPHYIIIDRNGEVVMNDAVSPRKPKEVVEQLKTVGTLTVYILRLFWFVFLYLVFSLIASFAGKRFSAYKFSAYNVLFVITALVLVIIFGNTDNVVAVLYLSLCAALNVYLLISGGLDRLHRIPLKIFLEFIIVFGLLSGVLVAIAYAGDFRIKNVFSGYFPDGSRTIVPGCWLQILQSALTLALIIVGLKNTYNFYLASRTNKAQYRQLRQSQLQKDLVQAKLDALQAKINPHFLYNSLNSIAGLALVDGEKTRQMALALSKFFRYGMNREQNNLTSLADELDIIRTYLDIEKIRFGERIDFSIMADEPSLEVLVPRMLFQPLVENSVKHGLKDGVSKISIWVEAKIYNDTLIVSVSDNGAPFASNFVPGYGLKSVYDKLDLLFPGNYQVEILVNKKKQVRIEIPMSAAH